MSSPNSDHRTTTAIIIRALSIHIFALVNYGQLDTLLNLPSGLHTTSIFVFAFYPALIIAQLLLGVVNAVKYYLKIRNDEDEEMQSTFLKPTISFYFGGILGVHAEVDHGTFPGHDENYPATAPLFSAGHGSLLRRAYKITWQWPGRILLSIATLTQGIFAVLVWIRRLKHDSVLIVDTFNGVMAMSSVIASVVAVALLLLSHSRLPTSSSKPMRGGLSLSLLITPVWISVISRDRLLVLGTIFCIALILFRRREVLRKIRLRLGWVEVGILWAIVALAVGDIEYMLGSAIGGLIEGRHGG